MPCASTVGIGIIGIVTLVLAYEANIKLENQNTLITIQNELAEAQRRSSLNIELSSIMNTIESQLAKPTKIDIKKPDDFKKGHKTGVYKLNEITNSRIIAISQSLKPYRALSDYGELNYSASVAELRNLLSFKNANFFTKRINTDDFLEKEYLSPERGQLLVALSKSRIILEGSGGLGALSLFHNSDLRRVNLRKSDLRMTQLDYSNITYGQLDYTIFDNASIRYGKLMNVKGTHTRFKGSDISRSDFSKATLFYANFAGSLALDATFKYTQLAHADFTKADLEGVSFENANLQGATFKDVVGSEKIRNIKGALILGLKDAPAGFVDWALSEGATLDSDGYINQLKQSDPEYFYLVSKYK